MFYFLILLLELYAPFFFIAIHLIYNVFISTVQQGDSVLYFFIFFSIMVYYQIVNTVPFAIQ